MDKKYELTNETITIDDHVLHQIRALIDFAEVKAGELGGFIESEDNLSHDGHAWVHPVAYAYGNARVHGDARICGHAAVSGNAEVFGNAYVIGHAHVLGDAHVYGNGYVSGSAYIYGESQIYDHAHVFGDARIYGTAHVHGNVHVSGDASIGWNANLKSDKDYTTITGFGTMQATATFYPCGDGEIRVTSGDYSGTIQGFREYVEGIEDQVIAEEYRTITDLMEFHFKHRGEQDDFITANPA